MWFPDGKRLAFLTRVWPDLATFEKQEKRLKERDDAKMQGAGVGGRTGHARGTHGSTTGSCTCFAVAVEGGTPSR